MTAVSDVTTRDAAAIGPTQTLSETEKLMDDLNVRALPVCDGPRLNGMLRDRDIVVRAVSAGLHGIGPIAEALRKTLAGKARTGRLDELKALKLLRQTVLL
ncbi:CBS domain-containing protein [Paraburkholderia bengalensis]|uniref:CBS domain-containing protein n=1 Tax=Paraburkholderia bengalensis TaxID=2747562 RepID=A0ABU8IWN4_9BURK